MQHRRAHVLRRRGFQAACIVEISFGGSYLHRIHSKVGALWQLLVMYAYKTRLFKGWIHSVDSTGDVVPYLNKCIVVLVYDPLSILLWTSPFFVFVSCSHNQSCSTLSQSSVPFLGGKQHSFLIHTHVFSSVFPAKRAVRGGFILATYINTHLRAGWGLGVPPTTVKVYIACWVHISLPPMLLLPWEQKIRT